LQARDNLFRAQFQREVYWATEVEVPRFLLESVMENRTAGSIKEETTTITTTLGELVEAITDIALQAGKTEAEGYALASITIEKVLRERRRKDITEA